MKDRSEHRLVGVVPLDDAKDVQAELRGQRGRARACAPSASGSQSSAGSRSAARRAIAAPARAGRGSGSSAQRQNRLPRCRRTLLRSTRIKSRTELKSYLRGQSARTGAYALAKAPEIIEQRRTELLGPVGADDGQRVAFEIFERRLWRIADADLEAIRRVDEELQALGRRPEERMERHLRRRRPVVSQRAHSSPRRTSTAAHARSSP